MTSELSATELVVQRLDEHGKPESDKLCQVAIEGDRYADKLDYEDWTVPLKLTGGTVCLEVTGTERDDFEAWYQMRSDTLHHRWESKHTVAPVTKFGPPALSHLEYDVENENRTVKPVPVEETPFTVGEGEDVR